MRVAGFGSHVVLLSIVTAVLGLEKYLKELVLHELTDGIRTRSPVITPA